VAAGVVFAEGMVRLGGVLVGISGLFDMMDGLVAKIGKRQTRFGALLDSTVDRYGEIAIFIGLAVLFRGTASFYGVIVALCGSMMVSYVKARAEGLGYSCDKGLLQRPERLVIILVGALLGIGVLKWAIWLVAVLSNVTALERLLRVREPADDPDDRGRG
jgi:CDP-diacylglycerol--glycerol-3-phosphate 3-phosphatidyltransferase